MARRKIVPRQDEAPDEWPNLSPTDNALLAAHWGEMLCYTEAYRKVFGAEGYSNASLKVRASQKFSEPKMRLALKLLNRAGHANHLITRDEWLKVGMTKMGEASNKGNDGAAQAYWKEIGRASGFYPADQVEVIAPKDPLETLNEIAKLFGEEAARKAAEAEGIHWQPETETRH